jgi:hypothetical protein
MTKFRSHPCKMGRSIKTAMRCAPPLPGVDGRGSEGTPGSHQHSEVPAWQAPGSATRRLPWRSLDQRSGGIICNFADHRPSPARRPWGRQNSPVGVFGRTDLDRSRVTFPSLPYMLPCRPAPLRVTVACCGKVMALVAGLSSHCRVQARQQLPARADWALRPRKGDLPVVGSTVRSENSSFPGCALLGTILRTIRIQRHRRRWPTNWPLAIADRFPTRRKPCVKLTYIVIC